MPQFQSLISFFRKYSLWAGLTTAMGLGVGLSEAAIAQVVGNNGTTVTPNGNQLAIFSPDVIGSNHFFSFDQFNLSEGTTAVFQNRSDISNVLAKVSGGSPSTIAGSIDLANNRANFYFMNPAGILFTPTAQLNLSGAFTATTASGIGFGNATWWNAETGFGTQEILSLREPDALRFSPGTPGAIVNHGTITAANLALTGGTVINRGSLATAPGGNISLASATGNTVQFFSPGQLLSYQASSQSVPPLSITPIDLPTLITGGNSSSATNITIGAGGTVTLTSLDGKQIPIQPGDIYTANLTEGANNIMLMSQKNLYGEALTLANPINAPRISLIAEGDIKLSNISILSIGTNPLIGSLEMSATGNIFVNDINTPKSSIGISTNGIFQADSILGYSSLRIHHNGFKSPDPQETPKTLDIQGRQEAPFLIGPGTFGTFAQQDISYWLSRGVSGVTNGIIINNPVEQPETGGSNELKLVAQNISFGRPPLFESNAALSPLTPEASASSSNGLSASLTDPSLTPIAASGSEAIPAGNGQLQANLTIASDSSEQSIRSNGEPSITTSTEDDFSATCSKSPQDRDGGCSGDRESEQPGENDEQILQLLTPRSRD